MTDAIDPVGLALLSASFEAAMRAASVAELDAALFGLGWGDVLHAAPGPGAAVAFAALGATGATGGLLDDVIAHALGIGVSADVAIIMPKPGGSAPPGRWSDDSIVVDGIVSTRLAGTVDVRSAWLPVDARDGTQLARLDAAALDVATARVLDTGAAYRRIRTTISSSAVLESIMASDWDSAVAAARVALSHQLVAASRAMLGQARDHAVERVQFGRTVGSFQAVRHRLADSLVHIEGAAAVADACADATDPLLAAVAKSLAGQAARTTARNAQQVLAGIGFTTDHPFQAWMKRVLTVDALFGSATSLPIEIGAELVGRGGAPRLVEL